MAGKLDAGTKHLTGIGVTKLVRDDAFGDAGLAADTAWRYRRSWRIKACLVLRTGQQAAIGGQRIEGAEEAETLDQLTHEGVYRDHAFGLQLAERHVNRPLIRAGGVETIEGKVGRFADAHAGVAKQQEDVGAEIIAAQQFLLEELILLRGRVRGASVEERRGMSWRRRSWASSGRCALQASSCENAAKEDKSNDVGDRRQGGIRERSLAIQPRMCGSRRN